MSNKKMTKAEKLMYFLNQLAREFLVGTSIYLNMLFVLKINNQSGTIVSFFWLLIISFMFDNIVLRHKIAITKEEKITRIISLILRIIFIFLAMLSTNTIKLFL